MGLTQVSTSGIKDATIATADIADQAVTSNKIANGTIDNVDISTNAAITGSKIDPDFGSQNITTTGTIGSGDITISGTAPRLILTDSNNDSDFRVNVDAGLFSVQDTSNSFASRLEIGSDGRFRVGCTAQPSSTVGGFQLDMGSYPGTLRLMSGAGTSGTDSASLSIGGSNHNASLSHGANYGGQLNLYNYNTTDGNSTAVSFHNSNGLASSRVVGNNTSHSNRTGNLVFMTSNGSHPDERMRVDPSGKLLIRGQAAFTSTSLNDRLQVKSENTGDTIALIGRNGDHSSGMSFYQNDVSTRVGYLGANATRVTFRSQTGEILFQTNGSNDRFTMNTSGVLETASKTITGGDNNAIQNFTVKGVWSGLGSVGKSIELISGYDSSVKMAAVSYNLTDTSTGGTYGGDLNLHSQPLYSSPTTPIPIGLKVKSDGCVIKPKNPSFRVDLNSNQNNTTLASGARKFSYSLGHNFDQERWDRGNNYSDSNTRFTAPVDGTYVFHIYLTGHSASQSQSYAGIEIYINGTRYNGGWNKKDAGYMYEERTYVFYLSDGDYVEPGYELANNNGWSAIATNSISGRYCGWEGYLQS
tara:strand:+ start:1415 stop:3169 length:1755 start_codon:yes stop_codon:yes gene_type:complete